MLASFLWASFLSHPPPPPAIHRSCSFGSLAFAAQSLIAALGSVQLIANLFLSRWVTRERVSVRIWVATAIIVAGGVLLVAFGNHESPAYTVQDLLGFYAG